MKKITVYSALCFFALALLTFRVIAQTAQNELSITAFPAVQEKEVAPGEHAHLQVQFKNATDAVTTGQVRVADYIINDKSGSVVIIEDNLKKPAYSASSWITLSSNTITIPPKDVVTVDLFVSVPAKVASCGNYALIYFQPTLPSNNEIKNNLNSTSGISAKIGTLINFKVSGRECKENINVISFTSPPLEEYGPVKVSFELLNTGDIHLSPQGIVTMTNFLNNYVDSEKIKDQRIFPETAKKYESRLGHKWMLGRYKIDLAASYGANGKRLIASTFVWVIPWKAVSIVLLTFLIIFLLIRSMVEGSRKRSQVLQTEVEHEREEIEKLKEQLKRRRE